MLKSKPIVVAQYLLFIAISFWLIYFSFSKVDLVDFYEKLLTGNYSLLVLVFIVSVVVYIIRVKRWQFLLNILQQNLSFKRGFAALASCYLVSFAIPRAGEIVRCLITKRTDSIDLASNGISIVFERLVDILCLFMLLVCVLGIEFLSESKILINWIDFGSYLVVIKKYAFLLGIIIFSLTVFLYLNKINRIKLFVLKIWNHLKHLLAYAKNWSFIMQTFSIWLCYFFMTYLWFFVFKSTSQLSLVNALQITLVGSLARSLPLPGGAMGAYHIAVAFALNKMGIDNETALALAFIIHGFQSIFTLLMGGGSLIWLSLNNKIYFIK